MSSYTLLFGLCAFIGLAALAAAVGGLGYGIAIVRQHGQRIGALETKLAELETVNPHTRVARAHQDIGEAFLFQLASLLEDKAIVDERLKQILDLAEHVRAGGKPDDLRAARTKKQ